MINLIVRIMKFQKIIKKVKLLQKKNNIIREHAFFDH